MRPASPINLALPITPMLDMSFQLLAFFLLIFRPMPAEGQLAIKLPSPGGEQTVVGDEQPDVTDHYKITIYSSPTGKLGTISLTGPANVKADIRSVEALLSELKTIPKPAGQGADRVAITIESSSNLQYARLIDVLDACKRAGFNNLSLAPIPAGDM